MFINRFLKTFQAYKVEYIVINSNLKIGFDSKRKLNVVIYISSNSSVIVDRDGC